MSLTDGTRLEHYEIVGPLGAGGMGEVYRAVDTKLRREVAIKILPAKFASDPSRLAHFEREAHLLAALNHPNIAAIYGLEHVDGIRFLVLELVEGPTLSERLKAGPMEVREALGIAGQIAEAFEAAHEKGVVHRDLKPANVKITPAGKVKVLDFGLAKALGDPEPASASGDPDAQATVTLQETKAGVVLGTAACMSPEQAEGKPTDKRSDVWSFGVVLYEMLSGKRCFDGKTTSHVLVHVLEQDPNWEALPASVPPGAQALLERCLQKNPAKRLRDVGDLRLQLEAMEKEAASGAKAPSRLKPALPKAPLVWPTVGAAAALVLVVGAFLYFRPRPAPVEVSRFDIAAPEKATLSNNFVVSPDGRKLAFIATGEDGVRHLWIRSLETGQARALDGTSDANGIPIWSPDSRNVVVSVGNGSFKLMKMEASGSPPQMISNIGAPSGAAGGFWTSDNKIVFAQTRVGVREVSAAGGEATMLIAPRGQFQRYPVLLPDGNHFLYTAIAGTADGGVYLGSLGTKPEEQGSKKLLPDSSQVAYAPNPGGGSGGAGKEYLLFLRAASEQPGDTLMAQPFDSRKLELSGEPVPVQTRWPAFPCRPRGCWFTARPDRLRRSSKVHHPPGSTAKERLSARPASLVRTVRSRSRRTRSGWPPRATSVPPSATTFGCTILHATSARGLPSIRV
jgi:serine/threonine protein kinase